MKYTATRCLTLLALFTACSKSPTEAAPKQVPPAAQVQADEQLAVQAPANPVAKEAGVANVVADLPRQTAPTTLDGAADKNKEVAKTGTTPRDYLPKDAPTEVLFGTDSIAFEPYLNKTPSALRSGKYFTELGGSVLEIDLTVSDSAVSIHRIYRDPGHKAQIADYEGLHYDATKSMVVTAKLAIFSYDEGLLVWERQAKIGDLAQAQWIDYGRK